MVIEMNQTINKQIIDEAQTAEDYQAYYKRCGLCGRTIWGDIFNRFEHLDQFHNIDKDAASYIGLHNKFHGVIPKKAALERLTKLNQGDWGKKHVRNMAFGIRFELGEVLALRDLNDYDDDMRQKTIEHALKGREDREFYAPTGGD
jgi:hypothetical protein